MSTISVLLLVSAASLILFFFRYEYNKLGSSIPDPWFSISIAFLLASITVLLVRIYDKTYFSDDIKEFMSFVPIIGMLVEPHFKTSKKV